MVISKRLPGRILSIYTKDRLVHDMGNFFHHYSRYPIRRGRSDKISNTCVHV